LPDTGGIAKDYEKTSASGEAFIYITMTYLSQSASQRLKTEFQNAF